MQQLDFEFVLFASSLIDYDYIMALIADNMNKSPKKQKMTKSQIISLLSSSSNLMDEQEDLTEYINSLDWESGQDEKSLRDGYEKFKTDKNEKIVYYISDKYGLKKNDLVAFIENILTRMIFDGEKLTDLMETLDLGWKERREKELALMEDLIPLLKKQTQGRVISGLEAYE